MLMKRVIIVLFGAVLTQALNESYWEEKATQLHDTMKRIKNNVRPILPPWMLQALLLSPFIIFFWPNLVAPWAHLYLWAAKEETILEFPRLSKMITRVDKFFSIFRPISLPGLAELLAQNEELKAGKRAAEEIADEANQRARDAAEAAHNALLRATTAEDEIIQEMRRTNEARTKAATAEEVRQRLQEQIIGAFEN